MVCPERDKSPTWIVLDGQLPISGSAAVRTGMLSECVQTGAASDFTKSIITPPGLIGLDIVLDCVLKSFLLLSFQNLTDQPRKIKLPPVR